MIKKKQIMVIVSGYFNPIHIGHIEYLNRAKELGDKLFVIVNSDFQRNLKGSKEFMLEEERKTIIENIKSVDYSMISIDRDRSVVKSIEYAYNLFSDEYDFYFGNGGDQTNEISLEKEICKKLSIKTVDKLGIKIQSSSWLLNKNIR